MTARAVADVVASLVRPEIRALTAYHIAKADGLIKLDANESPFPMPLEVGQRLAEALASNPFNRYPDGSAASVIASLREAENIPAGLDVIVGNGSDELLAIITATLARPGAVMLTPEPTFVMYRMNAIYSGMRHVGVPVRPDFTLDVDAMVEAIAREQPALVFIASPNNPTGALYETAEIERIVRATPGLVVLDEAYAPFAGQTLMARAAAFPNLLVLRTLSKIGMAALRLGYAVAAPEWIAEFNKLRQPYNLNSLTQVAAKVLLAEQRVLEHQIATVVAERARLATRLACLPGVHVFPARANFVVVRVPDARDWFERLRAAGILVKSLHGSHPRLEHCLRITVGTPAENDALLAALEGK